MTADPRDRRLSWALIAGRGIETRDFKNRSPAHPHETIEINRDATPTNSLMRMSLAHRAKQLGTRDSQRVKVRRPPVAFAFKPAMVETHLPIRVPESNHRPNGRFAFGAYHPGAGLPQ